MNMVEFYNKTHQNSMVAAIKAHLNASRFIHPEDPPGEEGHGLHSENLGK